MEIKVRGREGESLVKIGPIDATAEFPMNDGSTLLVTEPEVERLHGRRLPAYPRVLVARGEAAKCVAGLEALWSAFFDADLERESRVLAVGGGTVSDLVGFAASTWMRGIAFEYLPTTLLAMVDAAVGGKTAIDFRGRKNLVGSFCQPRRVLCDVAFLDSLPDLEFASGMGEVIKHALIAGGKYLDLVEGLEGRRPRSDEASGRSRLEGIVAGSVACKAAIVNRDEREEGDRRLLNLGHTFGHAIESVLGIPHGHAVGAGLASAIRIAEKHGGCETGLLSRLASMLAAWGLPSSVEEAIGLAQSHVGPTGLAFGSGASIARDSIAKAIASDKKRSGEGIRFVLPRAPGALEIVHLPLAELETFVREVP